MDLMDCMDQIAAATDVSREELIRMAHEFTTSVAPHAIGGGTACAQTKLQERSDRNSLTQ
jgi:hypothetical protein